MELFRYYYQKYSIPCHNITTGKVLNTFGNNNGKVHNLAFSPDNSKLATNNFTNIRIWNLSTNILFNTFNHISHVFHVIFSPDGLSVASSNHDHTIYIWNLATGTLVTTIKHNMRSVNRIVFSELKDDASDKINEYIIHNFIKKYFGP